MSFDTTQPGLEAHRQAFGTPTSHSLESVHATNGVAAEIWAMPRNVTFTHTGGIQMMEETSLNGSRAEFKPQVSRLREIPESLDDGAPPQYSV
jgi:hypothetical protein